MKLHASFIGHVQVAQIILERNIDVTLTPGRK